MILMSKIDQGNRDDFDLSCLKIKRWKGQNQRKKKALDFLTIPKIGFRHFLSEMIWCIYMIHTNSNNTDA